MWQFLGYAAFGWFSTITGVLLGGLLVFRTKREAHDPLFQLRQPKGEAFVLDEFGEPGEDEQPEAPPEKIMEQTRRFVDQMFNRQGVK